MIKIIMKGLVVLNLYMCRKGKRRSLKDEFQGLSHFEHFLHCRFNLTEEFTTLGVLGALLSSI